jgi:hypothetical protein
MRHEYLRAQLLAPKPAVERAPGLWLHLRLHLQPRRHLQPHHQPRRLHLRRHPSRRHL